MSDYKPSEAAWPSSFVTEDEEKFIGELKLHRKTPFLIRGVRNTQLSIARFSGGINYNNNYYSYIPHTDELIREDVEAALIKYREKKKRAAERAEDRKQIDMFKPARKRKASV